jgi:hypothetical protein
MNIITKKQIKVSIKKPDNLGHFDDSIKYIREQFEDFTKTLNNPIRRVVLDHFNNRCEKHKGIPMLGEYLISLFGNLFSISSHILKENLFPWFLLYEYSLMLDDLLDKKPANWELELLSSQILLDKAIIEYSKIFKNDKIVFDRYESYRKESINSMIYEIIWSTNNNWNPTNIAIPLQGRKAALMKFGINCLFIQDKGRALKTNEEKALDDLCSGIQLIDDLTDFIDDYRERRQNVILQESQKWIVSNYSEISLDNLNNDQLLLSLIYSGSINNSLEVAGELFNNALKLDVIDKENLAYQYFKNIEFNLIDASKKLDELLMVNYHLKPLLLNRFFYIEKEENRYSNTAIEEFMQTLRKFQEQLPKLSN